MPEFVAHVAGKSENTKKGPGVRETLSADDVHRVLLSEFDNISSIGSSVEGVSARMGRTRLEKQMP